MSDPFGNVKVDEKPIVMESHTQPAEPNYRVLGMTITCLLGFVLLAFGMVTQLLIYHLHEIAVRSDLDDSVSNYWFYQCFGLRPTVYLLAISLWPWWILLAFYFQCAFQYRDNIQFARVFGYVLTIWGIGVLAFFGQGAILASMPFVILLSDLSAPPNFMIIVSVVSWLLPCVVIGLITCWAIKYVRVKIAPLDSSRSESKGV